MVDLVTRAVIKGTDGLSAPFRRMANTVMATQKRLARANHMVAAQSRNLGFQGVMPSALLSTVVGRNEYLVDRNKRMFESIARARTGNTAQDIEKVNESLARFNERLVEVAKTQRKTRLELFRGAEEAITAGISVDTITGTLRDVSKISIALNEDLGKTYGDLTDIILGSKQFSADFITAQSDAINGAKIQGDIIRQVADTVGFAAAQSNQKWGRFVSGLRQAVPIASQLGLSLKKTTALLGVMADAGFKGEAGGTALRTILARLINPTGKAARALQAAGLSTRDMFDVDESKFRSFEKFQERVQAAGLFYGDKKKQDNLREAMKKIFADPKALADMGTFRNKMLNAMAKVLYNKKPGADEVKYLQSVIQGHISGAASDIKIDGLLVGLKKMSPSELTQVFGVRRIPQAIALRENLKSYRDKLKELEERSGGSINRRHETLAKGFAHNFDLMTSAVDIFWHSVGGSGVKAGMSQMFKNISEFINRMSATDPDVILRWAKGIGLFVGSVVGLRILSAVTPLLTTTATLLRAITVLPLAVAASGIGKIGRALAAFMVLTSKGFTKRGLMMLVPRLRALSLLKFAGVAGGLALIVSNLDALKSFGAGFFGKLWAGLKGLSSTPEMKELGRTMGELGAAFRELFGYKDNKEMLAGFFKAGAKTATVLLNVVKKIIGAVESIVGFFKEAISQFNSLKAKLDGFKNRVQAKHTGMAMGKAALAAAAFQPNLDAFNKANFGRELLNSQRDFDKQMLKMPEMPDFRLATSEIENAAGKMREAASAIPERLAIEVKVDAEAGLKATAKVTEVKGPARAKTPEDTGASGR